MFRPGVLVVAALSYGSAAAGQEPAPPTILFDTSPRAVEYQLGRLTNDELIRVERTEGDPKYRPVYYALLTRKGLGREYLDEALTALASLEKTSPSRVLLEGLTKLGAGDVDTEEAGDRLLRVLFAQPATALRAERDAFTAAIQSADSPLVLRGAYGALMIADGKPQPAWQAAAGQEGHLLELLRSVPHLGGAREVREALFDPVAELLSTTEDPGLRAAAASALGFTRADAGTFRLVAAEVLKASDPDVRAAAVRSLHTIPEGAWPAAEIEPVVVALLTTLQAAPVERRTEPEMVDAIGLAEKLAAALPDDRGRALRRDLRALGVRVVQIEAVPEQMAFDLKWFVVEAGKPVQIVLYNPDAMSHNLLVIMPGSLQEVGTAAGTMPLPADPAVKPYVPDTPLVLQATRLLAWGERDRLNFIAPEKPGEYVYVCTFPGHWVRMYGVMLVVKDLEAWEASRTVPRDPMTGQPFPSQKH